MGKVTIDMGETTLFPISLIGEKAGSCWGANTEDYEKNYNRGVDCILSRHGRTLEFPTISLTLEGYSARVIRELYTHIGGMPTRLQASTRYIDYSNFEYVTPKKIEDFNTATVSHTNETPQQIYHGAMAHIQAALKALQSYGIPKEDCAMLLPFGMTTKVEFKCNLRELIQIFNQRLCTRAYWEFRELMNDIKNALIDYPNHRDFPDTYKNEWEIVAKKLFVPKCVVDGVCYEKYSCGRFPMAERREFN